MRFLTLFAALSLGPIPGLQAEQFPESAEKLLSRLQLTRPIDGPIGGIRRNAVQADFLSLDGPPTSSNLDTILDTIFFHLAPPVPIDKGQLRRHVADLGADLFAARAAAAKALINLGPSILPLLKEMRDDPDPERRAQLAYIIQELTQTLEAQARLSNPSMTLLSQQLAHLLAQVPDEQLPHLAQGVLPRASRGSDHGAEAQLLHILITRLYHSTTPGLVNTLAPLLESEDRSLALALATAIVPGAGPRKFPAAKRHPIHPLFLTVLAHPDDNLVFAAIRRGFAVENDDPLLQDFMVALKGALARKPPVESGIAAARFLFQGHNDPAGLEYLRTLSGKKVSEKLARLEGIEFPERYRESVEFLLRTEELGAEGKEDSRGLLKLTEYLLSRDDRAAVRAGIRVLEFLDGAQLEFLRLPAQWPGSEDPLKDELSKAVATDDGTGPGQNTAALLKRLREERSPVISKGFRLP